MLSCRPKWVGFGVRHHISLLMTQINPGDTAEQTWFMLQMCILDGNAYDAKCLEAGTEREEDLDGCSLLLNNKVYTMCLQVFSIICIPMQQVAQLTFCANTSVPHLTIHQYKDIVTYVRN